MDRVRVPVLVFGFAWHGVLYECKRAVSYYDMMCPSLSRLHLGVSLCHLNFSFCSPVYAINLVLGFFRIRRKLCFKVGLLNPTVGCCCMPLSGLRPYCPRKRRPGCTDTSYKPQLASV